MAVHIYAHMKMNIKSLGRIFFRTINIRAINLCNEEKKI